ncbi:MAG: sigma-54 dependent transcriptional regulator [Verrucomicrobiae bacterium]|nr:sigma-54 dependent transcriptional regulator [Verrucomicrobiae bacterium]
MSHILIVDDDAGCRESLKTIFSNTHGVFMAENAVEAGRLLSMQRVDLILLDLVMPDKDGLAMLAEVKEQYPDIPVIMISALGAVRQVVQAIRAGAYDYIAKPFNVSELQLTVERALQSSSLQRRVEILEREVSSEFPVDEIIGAAPSFNKALADIRKAAESDSTVLITGESGTGKELAARLLHSQSKGKAEPFVAVHCAALPETLMESELFGHEKGAFTGATSQRLGRFDLAGSGTVFLDEVAEMTPAIQVKLLRVLQEREYMRVGGTKVIRTNARIVAATSRDLRQEVSKGRFRDDLFYRLNVVPVGLPPLRERSGDIPLLVNFFLGYFKRRIPGAVSRFDPAVMEALDSYRWPGNVRELRNIVERLLVLQGNKSVIGVEDLPAEFLDGPMEEKAAPAVPRGYLAEKVGDFERQLIEDALRQTNGVQTHAARLLGTTRRILRYRMKKLRLAGSDKD